MIAYRDCPHEMACRALGEYVRASVVGANNALWMPVVIATAYAPVAILALLVLNGAAPPTPEDVRRQTKRRPMSGLERAKFLRKYAVGIVNFTASSGNCLEFIRRTITARIDTLVAQSHF
eukprot:m.155729 g.155729  ORF g.155729 m.155729 type:complete len:120 (-) comp17936_c1_seq31:2203-2562(-)